MFKTKLIYKFLINFLIFSIALMLPLSFSLRKDLKTVFTNMDALIAKDDLGDARAIQEEFFRETFAHLMSIAFYAFFLAFILALFSSRRFLKPIKALYAGAEAVKKGRLDIKIPVYTEDELGEVTAIFNDMLANLRTKTEELQNKDTYVKTMMDALWVVDKNDMVIDVNPAFTKMFGYERDQVVGSSIYDFLDAENAMIMKRELGLKRQRGEHSTYEINITAKDGSQIPVLITGAPIIRKGEIIGKIGIIKDFREQAKLVRELKESRDYLETVMNSIEDSILIINTDYRILKANVAALTRYGDGITGKKCYEITHNSFRPCWMEGEDCPIQGVFTTGGTWKTIHEHYDESGAKRYAEVIASPIRDSEGRIVEALEVMRDVTERMMHMDEIKRRNRELVLLNSIASIINQSLKAEEIFSSVIDRLLEALDMDGGCVFIIDEATRTLECSCQRGKAEQCTSKAVRVKLGDDIPGRVAVTGEVMTSSNLGSDSRVSVSVFKDTKVKGYCCIPVTGKDRILGVYCLFKLKEHFFTSEEEKILRAVGEMTGLALENSRLYEEMRSMFETQKSRRLQEQRDLIELSSKLTSARNIDEVIHGTASHIKAYLGSDAVLFWRKKDEGSLALIYSSGLEPQTGTLRTDMPSTEAYAAVKGMHVCIQDINTDERFHFTDDLKKTGIRSVLSMPVMVGDDILGVFTSMSRTPRQYRDDEIHFIRIISSIFGVALERSQLSEKREMDRMKTDIISSVSYELRTPLSAIVGLTEMLMDGEIEGTRAGKYLETIYAEGMRLSDMVSDLLNISRLESGEEPIRFSNVDFSEMVESVRRSLDAIIEEKHITLLTEVDPDVKGFHGDRERLRQLLFNLVDNAARYSDEGCYINLKVRYSEEYVILEVSDTGWGIPERDIPNLGKRFYRGDHGSRTKGTGLGLALCREIVRIHLGSIEIKSRLNKGTTVIVTLPYRRLKDA
ncbi:MAG: PAS domain-containing protein [Nitrospirae bacterium]|nr:PAS domain-containing protein [Nitrospirota bacterium]